MDLYDVYRLIVEAAAWGGDVSGAVELFNMALDAPEPLRSELLHNASLAARRALEEAQWGAAFNILLTAGVVVFTILLLKNYKRLLRIDKGEPAGGEAGAPTRRGEAAAALLIIYLILAAAVVSNGAKWLIDAYLDAQTQAFVAVGILGPGGRADNYPSVVSQGEEVKLYVYVMNYMKQPTWLRVTARYIDNLTEAPSPHGFYTREVLLLHNQSTTIPLEFRINKTGFLRIELWAHNLNKSLTYTGRSAHIYIKTK
ncbi:MAG: DUF1616 domain-containing protein [Pyrobaculum sp.]